MIVIYCIIFQHSVILLIIIQQLSLTIMERTLATVNINMGWGKDNPVLLITRSTNVPEMVGQFIQSYKLPDSAYDAIMSAIQKQLARQNIDIQSLGRPSYDNQRKSGLPHSQYNSTHNMERPLIKTKKQSIGWDKIKQKKQTPLITRIQFQKKSSPIYQKQKQQPKKQQPLKQNKIALIRTKSPIIKKDRSPYDTKRTISPVQNRTPLRQRQYTDGQNKTKTIQRTTNQLQLLSQIFEWLTRNQPKTMKVLNPEYVSFNGVKPDALVVLQNFFQAVEQNQFSNMDKTYFIRRVKQLGLNKRLVQTFQ